MNKIKEPHRSINQKILVNLCNECNSNNECKYVSEEWTNCDGQIYSDEYCIYCFHYRNFVLRDTEQIEQNKLNTSIRSAYEKEISAWDFLPEE